MAQSTSSYGSSPPPYNAIAPYRHYGTVTPLQLPSQYIEQAHTRSYGDDDPTRPTATETSLLGGATIHHKRATDRRILVILCGIVAVLLVVVLAQNTGLLSTLADAMPESEKEAARRESWRQEELTWKDKEAQWAQKEAQWAQKEAQWAQKKVQWAQKEVQWAQKEAQWAQKEAARRESWRQEEQTWKDKEAHWAQKEAQWAQKEAQWAQKEAEHEAERAAFEEEKAGWARARREEEKHRKEIEWQRRGTYWSEPWPASSRCHGYGTRPYSAELRNLTEGVNYWEACKDMPIMINNQWVDGPSKPCEQDQRSTWGTWYVNFGEPQCVTYWGPVLRKGCSPDKTGMRKYEAELQNLRRGDDWDLMCSTTPANIRGVHFDSPYACEVTKNGRRGIWEIPDRSCSN